jgi:Rrf2 family protein
MKLNEGIEWGLHCLAVLAGLPSGATMPTKTLAEFHGLSESYLAKHLQALSNAQLIESVPGPRGGYRLLRPVEEITLLDVVQAIDGPEPLFRCMDIRFQGPCGGDPKTETSACGIHRAMLRADRAWRDSLRSQTIADIVHQYKQTTNISQRAKREQWLEARTRPASR